MDPIAKASVARKFRGLELQIRPGVQNCSISAVKRLVGNCILMPSRGTVHLAGQWEGSYKYE
jgi:hypothetical protein